MEEGKLPIDLLDKLIATDIKGIQGVIQGPQVGCDVAVIDYIQAIKRAQQFYNSKEKVYVVFKTDPITFPTPNPGRYAVIVNANDVVTSGGRVLSVVSLSSDSLKDAIEKSYVNVDKINFDKKYFRRDIGYRAL